MNILEKLGLVKRVEVIKEVKVYPISNLKIGDDVAINYMDRSVRGKVKSKPYFSRSVWSDGIRENVMVVEDNGKEHFPSVDIVSKIEIG